MTELFRALDLDDKGVDGTLIKLLVGRRQVDEIGIMRHGKAQRAGGENFTKLLDVGLRKFLGFPLIVVLGKHLHGLESDRMGSQHGLLTPSRDRHVGTELA